VSRLRFAVALAAREARGSRRSGTLVVLAIAIGVGALVAINSFTDNLRESVRRESRSLLGADLVIGATGPLSEKAEALVGEARRATKPEADVTRVVTLGAMALKPGGNATRLVQLRGVDPGYPFYGTVVTEPRGAWARLGESGGAIVDPALLLTLGAAVGEEIQIGESRFTIRATIREMAGDVGIAGALGPRVFVPRPALEATRLLTFGARARHEAYLRLPPGADADALAKRLRPGLSAERASIRTVSEDQRRLSDTLSRFGSFLSLVALVALLLGGLGVASAVHVFVKRRLDTVAVLRCLGASAGTVLAAYLLQAVALGLLGGLLGAALGAAVQLFLPRLLEDALPVDVAWAPSWPAILGGLGVGVWVAVVFSLLPLLAVRRVSPLAVLRRDVEEKKPSWRDPLRLLAALALAASVAGLAVLQAGRPVVGLGFAAGIGTALAVLASAALLLVKALRRFFPSGLPYLYRQGLANLYRPANQTLMVVLSLGFGVFLLSTLLLVQHNLLRDLRVDRGASRPNVVFFDVQPDQEAEVEAAVAAKGPLTSPVVPIVPMRIQALKGRPASELLAIEDETRRPERWALRREYRSSFRDAPRESERLVEGAWWKPGEWRGRPEGDGPVPIALDVNLARDLRLAVGDEVVWDVQGVPVASRVACLREVQWARFEPNFFVIFPEGPLDGAPRSFVVLARVEEAAARARLQREVVGAHPNVSTLDLAQVQKAVESVLDKVVLAVRFMALFSLAAGALVLAGAVASSRKQRVREGALLRTLGATRPQLVRILLTEYVVLGALAAGTAILLSSLAAGALVHLVFDATFAFPGPALLGLLAAVLGLTIAVGLSGSTEVWRRPPLEVLRTE
jgi:putative ABC transport system permease protein